MFPGHADTQSDEIGEFYKGKVVDAVNPEMLFSLPASQLNLLDKMSCLNIQYRFTAFTVADEGPWRISDLNTPYRPSKNTYIM